MRSGFVSRVVAPEALPSFRPRCLAPWGYVAGFGAAAAASCAVQLHIQNVCPDCFC